MIQWILFGIVLVAFTAIPQMRDFTVPLTSTGVTVSLVISIIRPLLISFRWKHSDSESDSNTDSSRVSEDSYGIHELELIVLNQELSQCFLDYLKKSFKVEGMYLYQQVN